MAKETKPEITETIEAPNIVNMEDGSVVNFGTRAKLVSSQNIFENGFELIFSVLSGKVIKYRFTSETPISKLLAEMAAFGAASKAKSATAGAKDVTEIVSIINKKIEEFVNGSFVTRGASAASFVLSLQQEAYADVEGLDKTKPEVVASVKDIFSKMETAERTAFMKRPEVRVAINKLRLAQSIAELAAMEAEKDAG